MKLSVKELKRFKQNSAFIKKNNVLPIYDYLKFHDGTVTKSGGTEFIIQDIKCNESFLVDEKVLMNFVDVCEGDDINVKVEGNRVILSDKKTKVTSTTDNIDFFPAHPVAEENPFIFSAKHIQAMQIASEFIQPKEQIIAKEFVHVGNGCIMASDAAIAYLQRFNDDLPTIVFRKSVINAISKFPEVSFTQNDNYHFFTTTDSRFGFIKSDVKFFENLASFFVIPDGLPKTMFTKHDFIRFNDLCAASSPLEIQTAIMSPNKRNIDLVMTDSQYERTVSTQILAENKDPFNPFSFLTRNMNRLLKAIDDEIPIFIRGHQKYYVTGEPGFTAIIMESLPNLPVSQTTTK